MKTERELKTEWLSRSKPLRLRLIGLMAEHMERLSRADYGWIAHCAARGGGGNGTERKYIALAEPEAELLTVRQELERVEAEIREAIEQVHNPLYQTYLRMRFLAYKSERQIAKETGYEVTYIDSHVRKKAIDSVKMPGNAC